MVASVRRRDGLRRHDARIGAVRVQVCCCNHGCYCSCSCCSMLGESSVGMAEPYDGGYSGSDEECILAWVAELTKQPAIASDGQWPETLRDGVALCELANALRPGSVAQINRSSMPFPQRENVSFLSLFANHRWCAKASSHAIDTRLHRGCPRTGRGRQGQLRHIRPLRGQKSQSGADLFGQSWTCRIPHRRIPGPMPW